jgi:diguanylate cyclase (GGDEF)-like protein
MSIAATTPITDLPLWGLLAISAALGAAVAGGGALIFSRLTRGRRAGGDPADHVTGVANRRAFVERLETAWRALADGEQPFGLLVVDVDAFGDINHLYGRATGERVLAEVAERIRMRVRHEDFVARVDADEFAVICQGVTLADLEVIRRNLEAHVSFSDSAPVSLSIGIAAPSVYDRSGLAVLERARDSVAERQGHQPLRLVDDALAELLLR